MDTPDILKKFESAGKSAVLSLLGNGITNNSTSDTRQNPPTAASNQMFDIPKEELMVLCMKLNKKMQSLESKNHDLQRIKAQLLEDRHFLIDTLSNLININIVNQPDHPLEKVLIEESVKNWKNTGIQSADFHFTPFSEVSLIDVNRTHTSVDLLDLNNDIIHSKNDLKPSLSGVSGESEELKHQFNELNMRLKKYEQEIDRLHGVESSLKSQNISINNDLTEKSLKLSQVEKESEDRRIKQEETFMYLQMQLNALKTKSEALDSELKKSHEQNSVLQNSLNNTDVNSKLYKEEISLLQNRINKDEVEISNLKSQLSELNKQLNLVTLMRSETENLLLAIKKDYNKVSENYGESVNKLKNLEAENDSLLRRLSETHDMSQELTKLKSELDDQNSLITRLRQESLQNERNHAMKTAMLATAEVHIENLKKELSIRDETTKESLERVSLLQIRLSSAESRLQERVLELTTIIDESQKKLEELQKVHETEMTDLKEKFESQIESIQRENAKKSSTARVILSEKEEEIRVLQEKIKELQTEISSGGPNERRIFELASVQARRDAVHGLHSENREVALRRLQEALEGRDLELAERQQAENQLTAELLELRRITRREGVNMDYLKNIILQFMTFPVGCVERQQLVPVIATLLQFDPKELLEAQRGTREPGWGASLPVVEIKRSSKKASEHSSLQPANSS